MSSSMIEGSRTKPSTMKHCYATLTAVSSYADLSTHLLPSTWWIPFLFANTTKPNTASRCGVTSIYPT